MKQSVLQGNTFQRLVFSKTNTVPVPWETGEFRYHNNAGKVQTVRLTSQKLMFLCEGLLINTHAGIFIVFYFNGAN